MKKNVIFLFIIFLLVGHSYGQEVTKVEGIVINSSDDSALESVNIVNLNQVIGTTTNNKGEF